MGPRGGRIQWLQISLLCTSGRRPPLKMETVPGKAAVHCECGTHCCVFPRRLLSSSCVLARLCCLPPLPLPPKLPLVLVSKGRLQSELSLIVFTQMNLASLNLSLHFTPEILDIILHISVCLHLHLPQPSSLCSLELIVHHQQNLHFFICSYFPVLLWDPFAY